MSSRLSALKAALQRSGAVLGALALLVIASASSAQDYVSKIDEAIALHASNRPTEASKLLQEILTAPDVGGLPAAARSRAFACLAMSEWAMYRRAPAEEALTSAIRLDGRSFMTNAEKWAKENIALLDTVAYRMFAESVALFDDAEYGASSERLFNLITIERLLRKDLAAEVHKYLAFNLVAQRKQDLARREFDQALRFNPELKLGDESIVAPKLRRAFYAVQDNTLRKTFTATRRRTLLRALAWPGWGHVYRGERIKGYSYSGAQAVAVTGAVLSVLAYRKARDDYKRFDVAQAFDIYARRNSVDDVRAELRARYDRYRSNAVRANVFIGLSVGVWAASFIDAGLLSLRRDRVAEADRSDPDGSRLTMAWRPDGGYWQLQYGVTW